MRENHFGLVNTDEDAKADLEATPGSITQVSMIYAQANKLHILAIKKPDGKLIQPSLVAITDHTYPMARPLIMVLKGRPFGDIQTFVRFILGDRGQELVHKYNYLTLKELGITPPVF
jgi:ABC-type phosphate transport system substrate-binding protein